MDRQMLKQFRRSERGFALVLTLLFLPVFIGVGLLVIDIGRGNNAQADHQAAADALALAGARELDGQPGARQDARKAMEQLSNNVSFLGLAGSDPITLEYKTGAPNPFTVIFLSDIPDDDDTVITQDWVDDYVAETDAEAKYVYVYSQASDLTTFFFNPVTRVSDNVQIGAMAVAAMEVVTCDLTPLFMCNPFPTKQILKDTFAAGGLHGRMLRLRDIPNGSNNDPTDDQVATAGNIGFLRVDGSGAKALAAALAGRPYDECIRLDDTVETQPGAVTSAWDGFNTRFDVYATTGNSTGAWDDFTAGGPYPPAPNVRKGWAEKGYTPGAAAGGSGKDKGKETAAGGGAGGTAGDCARVPPTDIKPALTGAELTDFYTRFPVMSPDLGTDSKFVGQGKWNLNTQVVVGGVTYPPYWTSLYGGSPLTETQLEAMSSFPQLVASGVPPSRYDVYRWEISTDGSNGKKLIETRSAGKAPDQGELGASQCYGEEIDPNARLDRRTLLVAVVDCANNSVRGNKDIPFDLLAKVFLVNPGSTVPGEGTLDVEIVGLSENPGTGTIDEFLKAEAFLVR